VRPAHVTLAVVLQVRDERLQALLWQRAREPFLGAWSLPGGYLEPGETLEESIRRHLAVKVDVRELAHLEQLESLSDPGRNPCPPASIRPCRRTPAGSRSPVYLSSRSTTARS
jgi:ADP-ribose pyrophosphatase YjhB (NUDIX family)